MFLPFYRCNGEVELGSKALEDVLYRAQLELFPEALLVSTCLCYSPVFYFLLFLDLYMCVCVCVTERACDNDSHVGLWF